MRPPKLFLPRHMIMPYEVARDCGYLTQAQLEEMEPRFRAAIAAGQSVALRVKDGVVELIAVDD